MPYSLVVNFMAKTPIYPEFLTGRHLHALFLTLVSSVDKELGDRLHSQNKDKAFTLSPIQVNSGQLVIKNPLKKQGRRGGEMLLQCDRSSAIPAETACWWRISLLDDALFSNLTKLWLNLNPSQPWHLGAADLYVTSVLGTAQSTQPWANFAPYSQIYEMASESDRTIYFQLCTPTAFRQGKFDSPLPTVECVFRSLLARWNTYSQIPLSIEIFEYLFPSSFQISSEAVKIYNGHFIGCIGDITFRILGDPDLSVIKQINALADFALYSGIGRKTTMGMGMVRRVSHDR